MTLNEGISIELSVAKPFFVASRIFVLESVMEYLAAHRVFLVPLGLKHHASVNDAKIAWFNNPRHTPGRHAA